MKSLNVWNPSPTKQQISIIEEIDLGQQNHIPLCIVRVRKTQNKISHLQENAICKLASCESKKNGKKVARGRKASETESKGRLKYRQDIHKYCTSRRKSERICKQIFMLQ